MSEVTNINFEGLDEKKYNAYVYYPQKMKPQDKSEFENLVLAEMARYVNPANKLNSDTFKTRIKKINENNGNELLRLLTKIANESYEKEKLFYDKLQQQVVDSKIVTTSIINIKESKNKEYEHRYHQPCNQKALYIANVLDKNNDIYTKILQDISSSSYIERFIKSDPKIISEYQVYADKNNNRYITNISEDKNTIKSTVFKSMTLSARGGKFTQKGYIFADYFAQSAIDIIKQKYLFKDYIIENGWEDKIRKFMIKEIVLYASKPVLPKSGTSDPSRTRKVAYGLKEYDEEQLINLMNKFLEQIQSKIAKENNIQDKKIEKINDIFFKTNFKNAELQLQVERIENNKIRENLSLYIQLTDSSMIQISEVKNSSGNNNTSIYRYSNKNKDFSESDLDTLINNISNTIQDNLSSIKFNNGTLIENIKQQIKSLYYQYQNSNKTSSFFAYLFGTAGAANVQSKVQGTLGEVINAAILQTLFPNDKVSILGQTSNDLSQQAHIDIQIEINGSKIGIQSKQYNASNITDTQKFYADDYNLFSDTIERYFTNINGDIDKELIRILKLCSYRLITNKEEYGEIPKNIETEIASYFEQFARIADYTNSDLTNIKTNFFAYNFTLIPMSYIIHIIINSIYNGETETINSQSLFKIQSPKFNLKVSKGNSASEGTEGVVTVNLESIRYDSNTYGYTYQLWNTGSGTRNLVANVHFNGITVSVANLL